MSLSIQNTDNPALNEKFESTRLVDTFKRPLHDLRISVIDRCNFRCTYCMPEENFPENYAFLKNNERISCADLIRLIRIFAQLGTEKIRITGGEPLLRPDLPDFIKQISAIEEINDIALTTNGSLLKKYAKSLKNSGLHRLTVSLDTLDSRLFKKINGTKSNLLQVLDGIEEAKACGFTPIKLNVVIQKGVNENSILDLVEYSRKGKHILRFIEYMDVGTCNHWDLKFVVPSKDILNLINREYPLEAVEPDYFGEVAQRYRFADNEGEIGFVSSVSQPFCQTCTRARLSADGKLYTCLFSNKGSDLKELLCDNNDEHVKAVISNIWRQRNDKYSELRGRNSTPQQLTQRVEMFRIGG